MGDGREIGEGMWGKGNGNDGYGEDRWRYEGESDGWYS